MSTAVKSKTNTINSERDGGIRFSCNNLLDQQIMSAVKAIIENGNISDIKFLQQLEKIVNGDIKLGYEIDLSGYVKVDEYDNMEEEKDEQIDELEADLEEERTPANLLDAQLKEAFDDIKNHQNTNQVVFLQHLQPFTLNGFK